MAISLLKTKLYVPPTRSALIVRSHLFEQLDRGLDGGCRLILVSAPAGFGKTTLVSHWAQQLAQPPAWLSLDKDDDDLNRFWTYVIAALQRIDPKIGNAVLPALDAPAPGTGHAALSATTIVTALLNELAEREDTRLLVLDDYHLIEDPRIHAGLAYLLDHMPPQFHLAILTRADPPLPLARLRARSQMIELRGADLRLTPEEVASFLNVAMDLGLSPRDVTALEARTEGWIVGLQMAALSLQGRADKHRFIAAFAGSDRYVADYLIQDVFERQPAHIQAFLLQTSILERLCAPLCDAVRGVVAPGQNQVSGAATMPSQEILEYLERANLFVEPLDAQRRWYRYHGLFAELLRQRLRMSPAAFVADAAPAQLHERASAWYEAEGMVGEAIWHALAAPVYERAVALIEAHALPALCRGEIALVRRWLDALPEKQVLARPALCLAYAWYELLSASADAERVPHWLARFEEASPGDDADQIRAYVDALRAYLAFDAGEIPQVAIERAEQALAHLPQEEGRVRSTLYLVMGQAHLAQGDLAAADRALAQARQSGHEDSPYIAVLATYLQAHVARERGLLRKAAALCRDVLQSFPQLPDRPDRAPVYGAALLYVVLGSVLFEWNDLEAAAAALGKGYEQIRAGLGGHPIGQVEGCTWMARLRYAQGDVAGALSLIEDQERSPDSPVASAFLPHLSALRARLWVARAEVEPVYLAHAARWARENQLVLDREAQPITILPLFRRDEQRLALVRLCIAQHRAASREVERPDLQPALRFLDAQLAQASEQGWGAHLIEALALRALALEAMGQLRPALVALQRALSLAEPEGYVRPFLEGGTPMARLLYQAAQGEVAPSYAAHLLATWQSSWPMTDESVGPNAGRGRSASPDEGYIEPLSERELEVLGLIAAGLPNREIAQRLYISVGTVKVHSSHIYGKLDVRSRTQAVAKARALGIVPDTVNGHDPPSPTSS